MSSFELIEKKSRFISFSKQIDSEESAKSFIGEITREHKRARHIAFAYVLPDIEKCSDAGEPRGTAGQPLLNAILRRSFCGVIVVVVRYFGGVLLGKGGLIRAYGKAAGKSLDMLFEEEADASSFHEYGNKPNAAKYSKQEFFDKVRDELL